MTCRTFTPLTIESSGYQVLLSIKLSSERASDLLNKGTEFSWNKDNILSLVVFQSQACGSRMTLLTPPSGNQVEQCQGGLRTWCQDQLLPNLARSNQWNHDPKSIVTMINYFSSLWSTPGAIGEPGSRVPLTCVSGLDTTFLNKPLLFCCKLLFRFHWTLTHASKWVPLVREQFA